MLASGAIRYKITLREEQFKFENDRWYERNRAVRLEMDSVVLREFHIVKIITSHSFEND